MQFSQLLRLIAVNIGIVSFAVSYPRGGQNRAAFFQDNDSAANSLVAVQIPEHDGTLSNPVRTSTGGKGLASLVAVSQDSVVVDGDVNPSVKLFRYLKFRNWQCAVHFHGQRRGQHLIPLHKRWS